LTGGRVIPIYQYECPKCGHEQEFIKSIASIDEDEWCGVCGVEGYKSRMTRLCGNSGGFRLKGDGWGVDGYSKYIGDVNETRRRDGKPDLDYNTIHGTDLE
jgi:putative FmdB family regulatory protein